MPFLLKFYTFLGTSVVQMVHSCRTSQFHFSLQKQVLIDFQFDGRLRPGKRVIIRFFKNIFIYSKTRY